MGNEKYKRILEFYKDERAELPVYELRYYNEFGNLSDVHRISVREIENEYVVSVYHFPSLENSATKIKTDEGEKLSREDLNRVCRRRTEELLEKLVEIRDAKTRDLTCSAT